MVSKRRSKSEAGPAFSVAEGLKDIYQRKIRPAEDTTLFEKFHSAPITSGELASKPIVLLIGQYSTGKTSFIQHLLGRNYPGAHIGPEPTTDRFVAVTHGEEERIIPGNAATSQNDKPFTGLTHFGSNFLSKFQVSESPAALLESVSFIDTPGVLSGDKQRLGRSYDYVRVCQWFAERSDMILLLFDAHKLDISDELKDVITAIRPYEDKIRIVLNKADQVTGQQLMRVYGALMWSLGKVIHTPEVVRVYIGSFLSSREPRAAPETAALLEAEQADLLNHLNGLPKDSSIRKINEMIKRAKLVRVHCLVMAHLKAQMPTMWGKGSKQAKLVGNLKEELYRVHQEHRIPHGDLPDPAEYQAVLRALDLGSLSRASSRQMDLLHEALAVDLPELLHAFATQINRVGVVPVNPFDGSSLRPVVSPDVAQQRHRKLFRSSQPEDGRLSGERVKELFARSGLGTDRLAEIWAAADTDQDGQLTEAEFCVAMQLLDELVLSHKD